MTYIGTKQLLISAAEKNERERMRDHMGIARIKIRKANHDARPRSHFHYLQILSISFHYTIRRPTRRPNRHSSHHLLRTPFISLVFVRVRFHFAEIFHFCDFYTAFLCSFRIGVPFSWHGKPFFYIHDSRNSIYSWHSGTLRV